MPIGTRVELTQPLTPDLTLRAEADAGVSIADGGTPTLEQFIYEELVPRMIRIGDSGPCLGDPQQMQR